MIRVGWEGTGARHGQVCGILSTVGVEVIRLHCYVAMLQEAGGPRQSTTKHEPAKQQITDTNKQKSSADLLTTDQLHEGYQDVSVSE